MRVSSVSSEGEQSAVRVNSVSNEDEQSEHYLPVGPQRFAVPGRHKWDEYFTVADCKVQ